MKKFCSWGMLRVEIESIKRYQQIDFKNSYFVFSPCCKKNTQPTMARIPVSRAYTENFYDLCLEAWNAGVPAGFNTSVDAGCPYPVCDWTNTELERIEVCFSIACNARCVFCHFDHTYNKELEDLYFKCISDLANSPIREIGLATTGEPLFNKTKTFQFLDNIQGYKEISIKSNLLSLTPEDAQHIVDLNNKLKIQVSCSINGIDGKTVSEIEQVPVDFERLCQVVAILYDGHLLTGISNVILPHTLYQLPILKETWNNIHPGLGDIVYPLVDLSNRNNNAGIVNSSKEWKEYFNGRDVKTGLDV